ncbi:hypothetical protein BT63DRAFT_465523 [Microthyrium microscopicum]|uniref:RNA polymerase II degradation factor 1 n=1 Tax=Microthyrium microscopicum TaxID=703497 RepID=A0A6A6TZ15_9PEZI|nr:hypothetical protein BT63DRAFT_465523 [Microthyrium microscopicum]
MSETASRPAPARGRGTTRGRGGFRGSNRPRAAHTNGDAKDTFDESDQGELGDMKKKYRSQLQSLKDIFPDWADVDLLFALEETDGDLDRTIDHISEGNVSQFSDVKKKTKQDRSRSKVKDSAADQISRPVRGRGNGDSIRGGRGRPDRGRGAPRVARGAQHAANGTRGADTTTAAAPSDAWPDSSNAWDSTPATKESAGEWDAPAETESKPAPEPKPKAAPAAASAEPAKKTWASMFKPEAKPAPIPKKPAAVSEPVPTQDAGAVPSSDISSGYVEVTHSDVDTEPTPKTTDGLTSPGAPDTTEHPTIEVDDSHLDLPPSKDQLTEDNVEHLPDSSAAPPVGTAASTVDSSRGPDSATPSVLAQHAQQAPIGRPAMGGYATTALKATSSQSRSASFQRRLLEQQEAVVMPGNHAVDRAAVQFGSLGLNGDVNSLDVDEDREEAETRAQPDQHSPVAQPKIALPPAPRQDAPAQESSATKGPPPGLPPVAQQSMNQQSNSPLASQSIGQQSQASQGYNHFGRFGQSNDTANQKSYDPFGQQQPSQQTAFDSYSAQTQAPGQQQQPTASQLGAFSSSTNDYPNYYTSDQQRAYQYYGGYGQQNAASQQEAGAAQQRTGSAFGAAADSAFPSSQSQQVRFDSSSRGWPNMAGHMVNKNSATAFEDVLIKQNPDSLQQQPSRFSENQQSGHNTPNQTATAAGQHASGHSQQPMHQQSHNQQGAYPYNAPYYNQPYYAAYMNQQYQGYNQQGFGGPFGKGGMYGGHPQHGGYGMPQSTFDQHSSSPAMAGSFGREAGLGAGLGSEYTRSGSTQPSQTQSGSFGNTPDAFGRSPGSFPGQTQQYGQQGVGQQPSEDSLKPFGEKSNSGPASGSIGQPGRPTSATNNSAQGGHGGLPPPQSQQGFGGYPSQFSGQVQGGQASQYGSLGGLGGHQQQQQGAAQQSHQQGSQYAGYGAGFGNSYQQQNYGARGGWGGNYGH